MLVAIPKHFRLAVSGTGQRRATDKPDKPAKTPIQLWYSSYNYKMDSSDWTHSSFFFPNGKRFRFFAKETDNLIFSFYPKFLSARLNVWDSSDDLSESLSSPNIPLFSRSLAHTRTIFHCLPLSISLSLSLSLYLIGPLLPSHSQAQPPNAHTHSHTHAQYFTVFLSFCHSLSCTHSKTISRTYTHTLTHSVTTVWAHTHTYACTHNVRTHTRMHTQLTHTQAHFSQQSLSFFDIVLILTALVSSPQYFLPDIFCPGSCSFPYCSSSRLRESNLWLSWATNSFSPSIGQVAKGLEFRVEGQFFDFRESRLLPTSLS